MNLCLTCYASITSLNLTQIGCCLSWVNISRCKEHAISDMIWDRLSPIVHRWAFTVQFGRSLGSSLITHHTHQFLRQSMLLRRSDPTFCFWFHYGRYLPVSSVWGFPKRFRISSHCTASSTIQVWGCNSIDMYRVPYKLYNSLLSSFFLIATCCFSEFLTNWSRNTRKKLLDSSWTKLRLINYSNGT